MQSLAKSAGARAGSILELSHPVQEGSRRGIASNAENILELGQSVPQGINPRPTINLRKFAVELTGGRKKREREA